MKNIIFSLILFFSLPAAAADYSRESFHHWIDADRDGENTREEAIKIAINIGIACPYTGEMITDPGKADIDHIIPLKWAWDHGAENWPADRREAFANDQDNLLPVLAAVNRSKGAKGPDEWLPPNLYHVPDYCAAWTLICKRYDLDCDYQLLFDTIKKYLPMQKGVIP